MKIVKLLIATVALSGALATTAHARDSFSIGINIGSHDHHRHTIRTHRHAPTYYGHYYYSEPRVIYYAPRVHYRYRGHHGYHHDGYYKHKSRHHYKKRGHKHHRRHNHRGYDRGYRHR